MAIHDAYARFTPYELLLPDPEFPDRCFGAIAREAEERRVDAGNPAAFVMMGAVQGAIAELREEDAGPESAHDHAGIVFFAYHLWRTGGGVVLAGRKTLRELLGVGSRAGACPMPKPSSAPRGEGGVGDGGSERSRDPADVEEDTEPGWTETLAGRAGYVQLPQHLAWIDTPDEPPESVDGFFWHGDEQGALHVAMVAGMRKDRPGYVVVSVPPQPLDALPGWASGPAREGGGDFSTSLPGAELDGLVGIRTPAEVFKLVALVLGRFARERPEPVSPPPPSTSDGDPQPNDAGPRPTTLPSTVL